MLHIANARRCRTVAATEMNAQSSRAHTIMTIHLVVENQEKDESFSGQLNLVDLAGE